MWKPIAWVVVLTSLMGSGSANATSIGVGGFGGFSIPIVQDDNGQGALFGVRVPVSLLPLLTVEPYFARTSGGDQDARFGGIPYTRSGLDISAYGANAMLSFGSGLRLFPYAGVGSHKLERTGSENETLVGYNFGLGFGITPPGLGFSFDLRGELNAIVDGDVSRKWANVTAGVTYHLLRLP